jgi:threonine/homoserine/homoserine lactone efflux protein
MPSDALVSIIAFSAASGVLVVTPGLDTAMILRSCSQGPKAGLAASLGVCLGLLVWGCAAAFGVTALLAASQTAFTALKWAGAAYLFTLGVKLIAKPRTSFGKSPNSPARTRKGGDAWSAFRRGFLSDMLNPKVGVFYMTFLPQFIPAGANVAEFSLLLAAIQFVIALAWCSILVALTVPIGRFLERPKVVRWLDRVTGGVFIAFGAKLALDQR